MSHFALQHFCQYAWSSTRGAVTLAMVHKTLQLLCGNFKCKVVMNYAWNTLNKYHWMKNWICPKFTWCKYVANMKFAKLCNQCKGGNGRICPFLCKFGHCHLCTGCKALQISYLQHICTRQIWCKFVFSSCVYIHIINHYTITQMKWGGLLTKCVLGGMIHFHTN